MDRRMNALQRLDRGARRRGAHEQREFLGLKRMQDGAQPVHAFGMAGRRLVLETGRMGDEKGFHICNRTGPGAPGGAARTSA